MYNIHLPSQVTGWDLTAIPTEWNWVMPGTFWVCTALCWQTRACKKHFLPKGKSREFSWPWSIHYSPKWSLYLPHAILGCFITGFNWNFQISSLSSSWRLLTCFHIAIPLPRWVEYPSLYSCVFAFHVPTPGSGSATHILSEWLKCYKT